MMSTLRFPDDLENDVKICTGCGELQEECSCDEDDSEEVEDDV